MYEALDKVLLSYPKSCWPAAEVRGDVGLMFTDSLIRRVMTEVKGEASPGVPLLELGATNAIVLRNHSQLVFDAVKERLLKLASLHVPGTPEELVQQGFCDPIRVFVKQEPHNKLKVNQRRFRLISSVSLVDQIVERLIGGEQNRLEILNWKAIPSKPGIGFSDQDMLDTWLSVEAALKERKLAEADISGWDFSVQGWELKAESIARIVLSGGYYGCSDLFARVVTNRFHCLANSVFSLSDGRMFAQTEPGIMKSGSYFTSSSNSRIRVLAACIIGANCVAMGDDSLEDYLENAVALYANLGHSVKAYIQSDGHFEFCSHRYCDGIGVPVNWAKCLYRLLSNDTPVRGDRAALLEQFKFEMRHSPELSRCLSLISRVGWNRDEFNEEEHAPSRP